MEVKDSMKKFKTLWAYIGLILFMVVVYVIGVAQIPSGRSKLQPQILNHMIILPDTNSIQFGTDGDVDISYDNTNGWLEFDLRTDNPFNTAPTLNGLHQPRIAVEYFNDFVSAMLDTGYISTSQIGKTLSYRRGPNLVPIFKLADSGYSWWSGTVDKKNVAGGYLMIGIPPIDSAKFNWQMAGAPFLFDSTALNKIWFETSVLLGDSTAPGFLIGLAVHDVDSLLNDSLSGVYFEKAGGANKWYLTSGRGAVRERVTLDLDAGADTTGNHFVRLAFCWSDTDLVESWVNGVKDSSLTSYLPFDSLLTLSIEQAYSDCTWVDWIRIIQEKP